MTVTQSRGYDRLVLGGYSPVKAQQVNPTDIVPLEGGQDTSVYQELLSQLHSLSGEAREQFLYRLRRTWLKAKDLADMLQYRVRRKIELPDSSERLQRVLPTYIGLDRLVSHLVVARR